MVSEVKTSNFKEEVILSEKLVLVDLYATWCGPCRALTPVLEEIAEKYQDKIKVVKVNVDEEESIAARFGVMSIPTVLIFRDGKTVASFVGLKSPSEIESIVENHL